MDDRPRRFSKTPSYGTVSKSCPHKLTFVGNFTPQYRHFDIMPERDSMRRDILNSVMKRTESIMLEHRDSNGVNPLYEDPRDVIGDKPPKPPRKRNIQGLAVISPRGTKEGRSLLKEQKRKLTKKYEGLITELVDKCEEHAVAISEKETQILKLKEKLKAVLEYNRMFADENDRLRAEHAALVSCTEQCRRALQDQQEMENRCKSLEEKIKKYEVPDKEHSEAPTAVPLVEVCMSCSSRQILLQQARDHNFRLQRDMHGLKELLYRLNVQLSRYQEKLRTTIPTLTSDGKPDSHRPGDRCDGFDSLLTANLGQRQDVGRIEESHSNRAGEVEDPQTARTVDLSGLLSAQALAPLFDAYQENLQEKDNLILDYEKQFENMNVKSKQIVTENKSLKDRVSALEDEVVRMRQSYKKLAVEKETVDIEKITFAERAEKAECKLKEVYELYEDKMAALSRDYETVHREYYAVRSALDGKLRARTVPADLHERRLDHCTRLLEELKQQYGLESERQRLQLRQVQEQLRTVQEDCGKLSAERDTLREELSAALKNVKLYRKAAVVFRQRAQAAAARATRVSRAGRGRRRSGGGANNGQEPLRRALDALEKIKLEIKAVKSRAHSSLEELERRLLQQQRRAALAQADSRRELQRAALALEHKEGIIRSLIDKVADVEEVRLSQTNTHRLQGIISDTSPDRSHSLESKQKMDTNTSVKLVPGPGGNFQEGEVRKKNKT